MRVTITALVLVGAIAMAEGASGGPRGDGADVQTASEPRPAVSLGAYAVRGTVRTVDASSLVIARSSKRSSEMSFVLRPSTQREGAIVVGATVSGRYVRLGDTLVATVRPAAHRRRR
jgi:hypothetical protein